MKLYDPLYGEVEISPVFAPIVNSTWFRRLQHLRQLGLCYLSFPGGNHSRFEHSLGAFHLAALASSRFDYGTALKNTKDKERLSLILQASLLCHDIGHGPFSHMTENVLLGLGVHVSHEEIGAAIVAHKLGAEFRALEEGWGISPRTVADVITKSTIEDDVARAAVSLTSGDLDLDRIDYLHRDVRYAGISGGPGSSPLLDDVWQLRRIGEDLHLELTENGLTFAESILFLRRNNYQRIVYESRHMAATAMFEKAVSNAIKSGPLKSLYDMAAESRLDWRSSDSVDSQFDALWSLFGLVDYSLLSILRESSEDCKYLTRRIQRGALHESVARFSWRDIHYLGKQLLLTLKSDSSAFATRRRLETLLAEKAGIAPVHVAVHLPKVPVSKPIGAAVQDGTTLGERSALGAFLQEDAIRQYAVEVFVDTAADTSSRRAVEKYSSEIITKGIVGELRGDAD